MVITGAKLFGTDLLTEPFEVHIPNCHFAPFISMISHITPKSSIREMIHDCHFDRVRMNIYNLSFEIHLAHSLKCGVILHNAFKFSTIVDKNGPKYAET